jgi:chromosomal replication initiation ATPase DnaA
MYLANVLAGFGFAEIGALLGRDRSTVAYACARIEDLRDQADVENQIARIETQLLQESAEAKEVFRAQG